MQKVSGNSDVLIGKVTGAVFMPPSSFPNACLLSHLVVVSAVCGQRIKSQSSSRDSPRDISRAAAHIQYHITFTIVRVLLVPLSYARAVLYAGHLAPPGY